MEILPIASTIEEPETVEIPMVEQPESYSDIAMLDSAEIEATFDALTQGPSENILSVDEAYIPPQQPNPIVNDEPVVGEVEQ